MRLKVGITYNLKKELIEDLPEDYYAEFDSDETIDAIAEAINLSGCKVVKIEADEDTYNRLKECKPHLVFNMAEGIRGESRESHIPALLEMMGIPYTGSGPLTLAIALNKALTHQLLYINGVPSPIFQTYTKIDGIMDEKLTFPLVVKPLSEGSSKGVHNNSLVKDEASLKKQVSYILKTYNQSAIVEEFLPGREFTVGILGNDVPKILPIVEILIDKLPSKANPLYSYEAKWIWDVPEKPLNIFQCPAQIPKRLEKSIKSLALKTYQVLNCRDVSRIDIRLDKNNLPHVLEVNPLPGLMPNPDSHSCLPEAARVAGYSYNQLICMILYYALKRYNMQYLYPKYTSLKYCNLTNTS